MKFFVMLFLTFVTLGAMSAAAAGRDVDVLTNKQVVANARFEKMVNPLPQMVQQALQAGRFDSNFDVMLEFSGDSEAQQFGSALSVQLNHVFDHVYAASLSLKELLYASALSSVTRIHNNGLVFPE